MTKSSDAVERREKRVPRRPLLREGFSTCASQAVIPPPPLACAFDPAALN
jgi:hypothetical protein